MDHAEYLPLFLAECRENLEEMTLAFVKLEEDPGDRDTIDAAFRVAHSLKGMSATMGFDAMAKLTHQMEDVLELMRRREAGLSASTIDVLLECLDALTAAVESIEAGNGDRLPAQSLIGRLSALVRGGDPGAAPTVTEAAPAGGVRVTLDPETLMPSVRAFQVLTVLAEHADVRSSSPAPDAVEAFAGREIVADAVCSDPGALAAALRQITDVAEVSVADVEPVQAADPGPARLEPVAGDPQEPSATAHGVRSSPTVRVDAARLDQLLHTMGDLVVKRTALEELAGDRGDPASAQAMRELKRSSQSLQQMVMQIRMIPIEPVFLRFPRLVRDVAGSLGKEVTLELVGKDTELDRTVVDAIGDPLVHLVRNALDHGAESPDERLRAGKDRVANVSIAAAHQGGSILISVSDDGRGIDTGAVARRAAERGLLNRADAAALSDREALELVFEPGFSTAPVVGDLSGRGVGMDVVRSTVRRLGGDVTLRSIPGEGTVAQIRLPLSLAIMPALIADISGHYYGFHVQRVRRTLRLQRGMISGAEGRETLNLGESSVPLLRGHATFAEPIRAPETHAILLEDGDRSTAITVCGVQGQRELVTRRLPSAFADCAALSGGAVLPSGEIVLLADCDALVWRDAENAIEAA